MEAMAWMKEGAIDMVHVPDICMPADFMTKFLDKKVKASIAYATNAANAVPIPAAEEAKRAAGTRWRRLLPSLEYSPLLDAGRVLHHLDYEQVPLGEAGEDGGGDDSGCVSM